MPFTSYAQNYEDVLLWRALKDVAGGFYIDIGAWDPDHDSVTRAFSDRGWTGINIEPLATWYDRLVTRRPRDINLRVAVGAAPSRVAFFEVPETGLSTTNAELAAAHKARGWNVIKHEVEVVPLARICEAHAQPVIHFLKIDCEGDEYNALAGADFTRFRPWIILLEAVDPVDHAPSHEPWEPLLTAADYRFVWFDGLNRFYVAAEHHDRLAPRLALPPNVFDGFVRAAPPTPPSTPAPSNDPLIAQTPVCMTVEDRIALAQRCRDCDTIPKVADAGRVLTQPDGTRVQIMHNGLKVLADGYCGPWMTRLIELCRGHHEPQEEALFHQIVAALPADATMIELGGNWAFYSAWFLQGAPGRRAVVLEPDPQNRAVGERTMALNGLTARFVAGIAGATPADAVAFTTERSGVLELPRCSVPQLLAEYGMDRLDLLHCDTQGAELAVLEGCVDLMRTGRLAFVCISTHAHQISGDALTHQRCLALLRACGAVIEAEHDPYESFSGDGLIVARLSPAPPGWRTVPITLARPSEAFFRHPSFDLAEAQAQFRDAQRLADDVVTSLFDSLLFRRITQSDLQVCNEAPWWRDRNVASLLNIILGSDEFKSRQRQFIETYFHRNERHLPDLPAEGPFECASLHLRLTRDGPLGHAGESIVLRNDRAITPAVIAAGAWNQPATDFIAERIDSAQKYVVLDVGANVGLFTRQVLHAFPGRIEACHCIEPDPDNYAALCLNLAAPRGAGIHTYPIALGDADGTLTFYRDTENSGNNSLLPDAMRDRPFDRTVVTVAAAGPWLDQALAGNQPILWKSDTQGNDEAIIAGASWPLWQRVAVAIVELWRIRKTTDALPGFLEKVADMPNRRLGGKPVSVEEVASYLAAEDWAHDDLYLWR